MNSTAEIPADKRSREKLSGIYSSRTTITPMEYFPGVEKSRQISPSANRTTGKTRLAFGSLVGKQKVHKGNTSRRNCARPGLGGLPHPLPGEARGSKSRVRLQGVTLGRSLEPPRPPRPPVSCVLPLAARMRRDAHPRRTGSGVGCRYPSFRVCA